MTVESDLRCWSCGALNDDATSLELDDALPKAGDVSVCGYCASIAIFTGDGCAVRRPTADEKAAALRSLRVHLIADAILTHKPLG